MKILRQLIDGLLALFLFLLPWQTRWLWQVNFLNKTYWEYGSQSLYATEILLWLIIILTFLDFILTKEVRTKLFSAGLWQQRQKYFYLSLGLLAYLAATVIFSREPRLSYYFVFRLLEIWCLALVIYYQLNKDRFIWPLWLAGVGQGIFALWQFFAQYIPASKWLGLAEQAPANLGVSVIEFGDERWLRAYGSLGSPNALGLFLAVIFLLGLYLYAKLNNRQRIFFTLGQICILLGLLLSFSRAAYLAVIVGIIFYVFNFLKHCQRVIGRELFYSVLITVFLVAALTPLFAARFNLSNRLEQKSWQERQSQYSEALQIFYSRPFWGVGPGAYTAELAARHPDQPAWNYQPVHSLYLMLLVETGLVGLFLFIFGLYWVAKNVYYFRPQTWPLLAGLLTAGLFDHWFWSMFTGQAFFCLILAIILPTVHQQAPVDGGPYSR